MPSMPKSKSKSKDRSASGAVKEQLNDSAKFAISATTGTFRSSENAVDDFDANSIISGIHLEYDMVSNNESNSGESEDLKEKTVSNIVDVEKREKIRLRNEKKHQRQRERRAQELHERCCSFLLSRKVESLSRHLVAMGFASEQATVALMMNDGKLEESVSWLLEGNTEADKKDTNLSGGCSLKIDITDELAQVAAIETRYNCSKKEVERAVVACEGDLQKAEEMVRRQSQEMLLSPSRSEETNGITPPSEKPDSNSIQPRKSERDLNYPNAVHVGATHLDSVGKYQQLLRENHANDRLWQPTVSNFPRNTFSPAASVVLRPPANVLDTRRNDTGYVASNIQQIALREPFIVMQRPPGRVTVNGQGDQSLSSIVASDVHPQQSHYRADYRHEDPASHLSNMSRVHLSRNLMHPSSPALNVPSSLGLFSSRSSGHSGSSTHVDWNHLSWYARGQMPLCDYTSIDWSMESSPYLGLPSIWKNASGNGEANMPVGSHEWTSSPFGGKDILNVPRQFVSSSSLW
ncbi:unnamed protein product [Rhodiola kirilowii]